MHRSRTRDRPDTDRRNRRGPGLHRDHHSQQGTSASVLRHWTRLYAAAATTKECRLAVSGWVARPAVLLRVFTWTTYWLSRSYRPYSAACSRPPDCSCCPEREELGPL